MRRFVIVGHNVDPEGDFALNDLCGGAGRLDVLLRCITSAFFISHGLRKEVEVYLVLPGLHSSAITGAPERGGPKTLRLVGRELRYLNPDERSTAALVRTALLKKLDDKEERPSTPGIYVSRKTFDELGNLLPNPVWLAENGEAWPSAGLLEDSTFFLSDHHDFTPREEEALGIVGARRISLGAASLHSHHCITLVHWLLDNPGGPAPSAPAQNS